MAATLSSRYRTALVTGASRGIGKAFAEALASGGVDVWGTSRDPSAIGGPVHGVKLDLADGVDAAAGTMSAVDSQSGGIDLFIHSAGWGAFGSFARADFGSWRRQVDEMAIAGGAMIHTALRAMQSRGKGTIVIVTSMAAEFPIPCMSGYNAAKSALSVLAASLMLETAGTGISVIEFRAGDYRTGFNESMERTEEPGFDAVWRRNNERIHAAPEVSRAAAGLVRALVRGKSGVVRSGGFFQVCVAPFLARLGPLSWQLAAIRRYHGIR